MQKVCRCTCSRLQCTVKLCRPQLRFLYVLFCVGKAFGTRIPTVGIDFRMQSYILYFLKGQNTNCVGIDICSQCLFLYVLYHSSIEEIGGIPYCRYCIFSYTANAAPALSAVFSCVRLYNCCFPVLRAEFYSCSFFLFIV